MDSSALASSPDGERVSSEGGSGVDADKSGNDPDRVFVTLDEDASLSLGTSLPTDLTTTTTFLDAREDDDGDTDENQNKIIRRRLLLRHATAQRGRPQSRRTAGSVGLLDRNVTKELLEKKQLEHDLQLVKIELSQKSLELDNVKADYMSKVDELEEKVVDTEHENQVLRAKLETQLAVQAEEHRRSRDKTRTEIKAVLEAQETLEASNEELRLKAGNLERNLTRDLFVSDKRYSELRRRDESSLPIKDVVGMRVYEVVKPLRDEVESLKLARASAMEARDSLGRELYGLRETLLRRDDEKNRLTKSLKEVESKLKETELSTKQRDFKKENYDVVKEELDDLKRRHQVVHEKWEFLEVETKKLSKEVESLARENGNLRQENALMAQDKEYFERQIRDLDNRCSFSEEKLRKANEDLEKAKESREQMYEKYVLSREESKNQYEEKLKNELDSLKLRTSHEVDRVRASIRELYDRENHGLRETKELALAEKEEAVASAKRLAEKVASLQDESKMVRIDADAKSAAAANELRLKTFEFENLQVLYEQAQQISNDLRRETVSLASKLEKSTKEYFDERTSLERHNTELTQKCKTLKDKLEVYEHLEKEMDQVVMQCAELEDDAQADKILFAYGYGANVPSSARRRTMQSVHLARRVLALERANVSQRRALEAADETRKALTEELEKANQAIEDSQQPYGYIIQTVKIKDQEIKNLKEQSAVLVQDIERLSTERDRLQGIQIEMAADLERLLNHRQEMALMKSFLSMKREDKEDLRTVAMMGKGDGPKTETILCQMAESENCNVEINPKPTIFTRPMTVDGVRRIRLPEDVILFETVLIKIPCIITKNVIYAPVDEMSQIRQSEDRLREALVAGVSKDVTHMCMIWHTLGLDAKSMMERTNGVVLHVEEFLKGLVNEEEELKSKIEKRIEQLAQKIAALCDELNLAPYEPPEHATPFQLNSILPKELQKLREEKAERMKEVEALVNVDEALSDQLGEIPYAIRPNTVPSRDVLKELEAHIDLMKRTLKERKEEFKILKRNIVKLLDAVGVTPDNTFQGDILAEDEESFDLNSRNMEGLRKYCQDLEEIESQRRSAIAELKGRLIVLWDQLDVTDDIKRQFIEDNQGCRQQVIDNFKEKVQQMKELRRANLGKLIEKLRNQIKEYWNKCYYSEDQKEAFLGFQDEDYNEQLLDVHEKELDFLKIYYEEHQRLFQAVECWEMMWTQFLQFEKRANDPNRFVNRGGGLLQEEKERNKLAVKLPKVEKELEIQIHAWESENGRQFQVCGIGYKEYVTRQRENHEVEKQMERESRLRKKQRETEVEMTFGSRPKTPTKRRFCGALPSNTNTPSNAKTPTKRQREESRPGCLTPTLGRKFPKLNGAEASTMTPTQQTHSSIRLALSPYRPPVPMSCPAKSKGASNSRLLSRSPGRIAPLTSRRALNDLKNDANSNIDSYEDFKRGVKPPFRSSSLTDLRNLHLAAAAAGGSGDDRRAASATPPDAASLAVRSFHEAAF